MLAKITADIKMIAELLKDISKFNSRVSLIKMFSVKNELVKSDFVISIIMMLKF